MTSRGPRSGPASGEPSFELQSNADQLVDIARADAILNRRDPDQAAQVVRAQLVHQGTAATRQASAAQIWASAEAAARARRRRRILLAVGATVVAAAAVPAARLGLREKDRADALAARLTVLGRPVTPLGLREAALWLDVPPSGVTFQVPRETCSALVATREGSDGAPAVTIERQSAPRSTASGGVLFCSCEAEKVTVTLPEGNGGRVALGWLSAATRTTGGIEVLAARPADGFQLLSDPVALTCADAAFQGWAERGGHADLDPFSMEPPKTTPPAPGPTRPGPTAELLADGFEPVGLFPSGRAFAAIRAKQGRCYLAVPDPPVEPPGSGSRPGAGEIALRGPDGARLVPRAGGAIAWCSHAADVTFSLWRSAASSRAVSVLGAPADRAGGIMGSLLALRRHGARDVEVALLPDELAKDARAALVAATVPAASIVEADAAGLPGKPESRIVGFSLRGHVAMLPEVAPAVPTGCVPELDAAGAKPNPKAAVEPFAAYLCVQARGQVWHRGGDAQHQGAVEGSLPYWLGVLDGAAEEGALRAAAAVLVFAQRLRLLGYETTTGEGVKDRADGAVVSGGGGKGDVVAVGISRQSPWLTPLTDGPSWSLTGPLRVVNIPPGATKSLRSLAPLAASPKDRRIVVWRR